MAKTKWFDKCAVCNVGLIQRIDEVMAEKGLSRAAASRLLAAEAKKYAGIEWITANAIEKRYKIYKKGQGKGVMEPTDDDSRFIQDMKKILKNARGIANKCEVVCAYFDKVNAEEINGAAALLARIDLARFAINFEALLNRFGETMRLPHEEDPQNRQSIGSREGR